MAVHIRLSRGGTNKRPFYRVMVADHRAPNGGRFLENIGTFNPLLKDENKTTEIGKQLTLDKARWDHWTNLGAQPSATLTKLVKTWSQAQPKA